jgi:hypothetical protein
MKHPRSSGREAWRSGAAEGTSGVDGGGGSSPSHCSQREIADEAMRRGLIPNILQRSVGRFLKKEADLKPHSIRYRLTPEPDPAFDARSSHVPSALDVVGVCVNRISMHASKASLRLSQNESIISARLYGCTMLIAL